MKQAYPELVAENMSFSGANAISLVDCRLRSESVPTISDVSKLANGQDAF